MSFTVEETNFMSYFDISSRKALIHDMKTTPLNDMDDEMAEMLYSLVPVSYTHLDVYKRQLVYTEKSMRSNRKTQA